MKILEVDRTPTQGGGERVLRRLMGPRCKDNISVSVHAVVTTVDPTS